MNSRLNLRVFRVMSSLRFFAVVREGLGEMDKEIEADSQSGRLDFLVQEAREEKANGTLKDL